MFEIFILLTKSALLLNIEVFLKHFDELVGLLNINNILTVFLVQQEFFQGSISFLIEAELIKFYEHTFVLSAVIEMKDNNLFLFIDILGINQLKFAFSDQGLNFIISMAMICHDATFNLVVVQFLKNHLSWVTNLYIINRFSSNKIINSLFRLLNHSYNLNTLFHFFIPNVLTLLQFSSKGLC